MLKKIFSPTFWSFSELKVERVGEQTKQSVCTFWEEVGRLLIARKLKNILFVFLRFLLSELSFAHSRKNTFFLRLPNWITFWRGNEEIFFSYEKRKHNFSWNRKKNLLDCGNFCCCSISTFPFAFRLLLRRQVGENIFQIFIVYFRLRQWWKLSEWIESRELSRILGCLLAPKKPASTGKGWEREHFSSS